MPNTLDCISLKDIQFWLGVQSGTKTPPKQFNKEPDWSKIHGGEIKYGAKVRILWNDGDDSCGIPNSKDDGYIFGLPGFDETDPDMGAIVHVPEPSGGEKSTPDPIWATLYQLCLNPYVERIVILEKQ